MNTYAMPTFPFMDYASNSHLGDEYYKPSLYQGISSDLSQVPDILSTNNQILTPPPMDHDFIYNLNTYMPKEEHINEQKPLVVNTVKSNVNYPYWSSYSLDTPPSFNILPNLLPYDYNPTLTYFYTDYRSNTLTRGLPRGRAVLDEHPSIRPFRCDFPKCGKMFKRSEHLKRHSRSIHSFYRPHQCNYPGCGKSFSRTDNLAQHKRIHATTAKSKPQALDLSTGRFHYPHFMESDLVTPALSPLESGSQTHINGSVLNHNIQKPFII